MKKNKLVIDYDFDFTLLGITSSVKGYKLAWELNRQFGVTLVKQPDLVVGFKNDEERSFMYYSYETPLNRLKLLKNKPGDVEKGKYFLVPEFPHFDFIILADLKEHPLADTLLESLKQIPSIEWVVPIDVDGLK